MAEDSVGVIGATSLVGAYLLPKLVRLPQRVVAWSRRTTSASQDKVEWKQFDRAGAAMPAVGLIPDWICVAPIWTLPEHFELLRSCGARRLVALSSTSRYTKEDSSDVMEQETARRLAVSEDRLQRWASAHGVQWIILRPTLIYGSGRDKNVSEIARFIGRFGFFPLLGEARGLRQPVHADDVAAACVAALLTTSIASRSYNLSGAETLTYREMVERVFAAMRRRPRILTVPLSAFRVAIALLRLLPRHRHWSAAMAERMNRDLIFDHEPAVRELAFAPRGFNLSLEDLP